VPAFEDELLLLLAIGAGAIELDELELLEELAQPLSAHAGTVPSVLLLGILYIEQSREGKNVSASSVGVVAPNTTLPLKRVAIKIFLKFLIFIPSLVTDMYYPCTTICRDC